MGGIRDYQFDTGFTTPTAPISGAPTTMTIANNQSSATAVTGLTVDSADFRAVMINYTVKRKTSTKWVAYSGWFLLTWDAFTSTWKSSQEELGNDSDSNGYSGMTLSVTTASTVGQVKYSTDNMSGSSYTGEAVFKYGASEIFGA